MTTLVIISIIMLINIVILSWLLKDSLENRTKYDVSALDTFIYTRELIIFMFFFGFIAVIITTYYITKDKTIEDDSWLGIKLTKYTELVMKRSYKKRMYFKWLRSIHEAKSKINKKYYKLQKKLKNSKL